MENSYSVPPDPDELEVSLFGPGYGEGIVVHLGLSKWMTVDSCLEPRSGRPAALSYLSDLKVDIGSAVELVVATHWHDDHIRGFGALIDECISAEIAVSAALDQEEFLALTVLYNYPEFIPMSSGLREFIHVLKTLKERRPPAARIASPKWAAIDRVLFQEDIPLSPQTVRASVWSLSPSDASLAQSKAAFASLSKDCDPGRRILAPSPNHGSVVLWVQVGNHGMLLGADLEATPDPTTGWSSIFRSVMITDKAQVFKIPHHGARSAHDDRVWSDLLFDNPFAITTPFFRGRTSLPSLEDMHRINGLTSEAYLTSPARQRRTRWREKAVREFVAAVTRDIRDVHCGWGHVRLRRKINDMKAAWRTELFGDACPLQKLAANA